MNQENRLEVLQLIEETQWRGDAPLGGTASVIVEIGGVADNGQVEHQSIHLHKANDRVIDVLRNEGFRVDLEDGTAEVSVPTDEENTDEEE